MDGKKRHGVKLLMALAQKLLSCKEKNGRLRNCLFCKAASLFLVLGNRGRGLEIRVAFCRGLRTCAFPLRMSQVCIGGGGSPIFGDVTRGSTKIPSILCLAQVFKSPLANRFAPAFKRLLICTKQIFDCF